MLEGIRDGVGGAFSIARNAKTQEAFASRDPLGVGGPYKTPKAHASCFCL